MINIAIDLGGTVTKIGLVEEGMVRAYAEIDSNSHFGLAPLLPELRKRVDALIDGSGAKPDEVCGVGIAFPGIVDSLQKKVVSTNAKFDDAARLNLAGWAAAAWGTGNFCIDNDSRLATIGEWQYGAGGKSNDIVMMTIGTGIGTGVIINGEPLYGSNHMAGSLGGHFVVDYRGRSCSCGNAGCVEALASSFFLPQIIAEHALLSDHFKGDRNRHNFKTIFADADAGDADATMLRNECMDVWSAAIVTYIHAYGPEVVVIGGGIMNSRHVILPYIRRKVDELAWCPGRKVEIVASQLEDHAALYGIDYCLNRQNEP